MLVVGAGPGFSLRAGTAFTELPNDNGDDVAVQIAAMPGTYRTTWDLAPSGDWALGAAVFAPAAL